MGNDAFDNSRTVLYHNNCRTVSGRVCGRKDFESHRRGPRWIAHNSVTRLRFSDANASARDGEYAQGTGTTGSVGMVLYAILLEISI
jgi:hypothetical protein